MNWIVTLALKNRAIALLGAAVLAVAGVLAWQQLPIDAFPDVSNTQVMVLSEAPGLAPLDVEQQVTFPLEMELSGLPQVTQVRSTSKSGLCRNRLIRLRCYRLIRLRCYRLVRLLRNFNSHLPCYSERIVKYYCSVY